MKTAPAVLLAIANELAKQAKAEMPKMNEGETLLREWYKDGIYCRETTLDGQVFHNQYDFRQRKSRRLAVESR